MVFVSHRFRAAALAPINYHSLPLRLSPSPSCGTAIALPTLFESLSPTVRRLATPFRYSSAACAHLQSHRHLFARFGSGNAVFGVGVYGPVRYTFRFDSLGLFFTLSIATAHFRIVAFRSPSTSSAACTRPRFLRPPFPTILSHRCACSGLQHLQLRALTSDASDILRFLLRFLWQLSASFRSRKLDRLRFVSVCFDIFSFILCSCVSTSLDFLAFDLFARISLGFRPLRLRALAFDVSGIASLPFCLADFVPFAFGFCGFIRCAFECEPLNLPPSF
jgi:hypothetical protein